MNGKMIVDVLRALYCEYRNIVPENRQDSFLVEKVERTLEQCEPDYHGNTGMCPHCCSPIGRLEECHPFSSDAGAYYVCTVCEHRFEPDEYEELISD